MFKIKSPFFRLAQQTRDAREQIVSRRRELLLLLGTMLLEKVQEAFNTKSHGERGEDGVKWRPNKPATIRAKQRRVKRSATARKRIESQTGGDSTGGLIGVSTGLLRASANVGFSDVQSSITVGYNRPYMEYFDKERELIPAELPQEWEQELDRKVETWADAIVSKSFN